MPYTLEQYQAILAKFSKANLYTLLENLDATAKRDLLLLLEEKAKREGLVSKLTRYEFATKYHITHKFRKLEFVNRQYLEQLYQDTSQQIVVRKAVQVGVSEWALTDALYMAMELGWSGAYVLTKSKLRDDFVSERINTILREVPYYAKQVGETNNLGIKQLGKAMLRFLGSNSESEFISFPADFIIVDEVDRCDQGNLALVKDRLQASEYKYERWISNPTIEGWGIDVLYNDSDQKQWYITCSNCDLVFTLDWFTNAVEETAEGWYEPLDKEYYESPKTRKMHLYCTRCSKPIDRFSKGQWIPNNPSATISGYHFSQLYSPTVSLEEMWDDFNKSLFNETKSQVFWNNRLGLAYKAKGARITEEMLRNNEHQYALPYDYTGNNGVYAGVDVGVVLHVVIRERTEDHRKLLYLGTVRDFDELGVLIERYSVSNMVIDMFPEMRKAKEFQNSYYDIVWLADYHAGNSVEDKIYNKNSHVVRANRTAAIDAVIEDINKRVLMLPSGILYMQNKEYAQHMQNPTRIKDPDKDKFHWLSNLPDHYLHAEVYCKLAEECAGNPQIYVGTAAPIKQVDYDKVLKGVIEYNYNNPISRFFYND